MPAKPTDSIVSIFRCAPLTDAFGGALDLESLRGSLRSSGLRVAHLIAHDTFWELRHTETDERIVALALTCLREHLSPLVPIETTRDNSLDDIEITDARHKPPVPVVLSEFGVADVTETLTALSNRLFVHPAAVPTSIHQAKTDSYAAPPTICHILDQLANPFGAYGLTPDTWRVRWLERGSLWREALPIPNVPKLQILLWQTAETAQAVFVAIIAEDDPVKADAAARSLTALLIEQPEAPAAPELWLDGLPYGVARRPIVAAPVDYTTPLPILRIENRCSSCGRCAEVCPVRVLTPEGLPTPDMQTTCLRCYDCVEACPEDALRPTLSDDTATIGHTLSYRSGWLSRIVGRPGPAFPAPHIPSYLLPTSDKACETPRVIVGLSMTTMQEHATALLIDGVLVGAIEEERLNRVRHYGWSPAGRSGVTLAMDPTLCLEEALPRRGIRALLEHAGLTLDDVDLFAINGLPARYRHAYSLHNSERPVPVLRSGRVAFIPHHLAHAASSYRLSGLSDAWVLTVDGRGDRETAALFKAENGHLEPRNEILSLTDHSIGGVYETVTRLLGFGSHGQGSTMALAGFGQGDVDLDNWLSIRNWSSYRIHENGLEAAFDGVAINETEDVSPEGRYNLAASLQDALEKGVLSLLRAGGVPEKGAALCLAGGVALNCQMNERIRHELKPASLFIQPGANDAGTALGAALEAQALFSLPLKDQPLSHALLGPAFTDDEIEAALIQHGVPYRPVDDISETAAQLLAAGKIVAWFQDRLEFGPRALGSRSLLADPRNLSVKDRLNALKQRQSWRPFGPSVLAGHERDWFENACDSRFMLLTQTVHAEKRELIPAVLHVDGTTRPNLVRSDLQPRYHALIAAFHRLTGVPLVLNTSFNRHGEPIVCTPDDALICYLALGADALAIGSFIVEASAAPLRAPRLPTLSRLQACPGGRRLSLRLTIHCECRCVHCTLGDMPVCPDRSFNEALRALAEGRRHSCDELVILRGEATHWPKLAELIARAKEMGYRFVQLQSNGAALAATDVRKPLLAAGLDAVEVTLVAASENDTAQIMGEGRFFKDTLLAIRALVQAGRFVLVSVPLLRDNVHAYPKLIALIARLGVTHLQFNFPRPVETPAGLSTKSLMRLSDAAAALAAVLPQTRELGLTVSTEGLPFCHLDRTLWSIPDAQEDWSRHRVDDLHLTHDSLTTVRQAARPDALPCRVCAERTHCPKTWALYLELFGSNEFRPFD